MSPGATCGAPAATFVGVFSIVSPVLSRPATARDGVDFLSMNRSLLTILAYFAVAILLVGIMRWLRNRATGAPAPAPKAIRPTAPAGPPLAGTDAPLPALLEPHRARLEALLAPAARLQPGGEPVARLGGAPRLPAGMAWPASPARPMSFIGELDLAALRRTAPSAAPLLPDHGRLALFYDVEEMRWGGEPPDGAFFRLVHLEAGGETAALRSLANAARLVEESPGLMNLRVLQSVANAAAGEGALVGERGRRRRRRGRQGLWRRRRRRGRRRAPGPARASCFSTPSSQRSSPHPSPSTRPSARSLRPRAVLHHSAPRA